MIFGPYTIVYLKLTIFVSKLTLFSRDTFPLRNYDASRRNKYIKKTILTCNEVSFLVILRIFILPYENNLPPLRSNSDCVRICAKEKVICEIKSLENM